MSSVLVLRPFSALAKDDWSDFFRILCRPCWWERQKNKVIANTRAEKGSPFLRRAAFPVKLNFHSPACCLVCANKILMKALVRRVYQPVAECASAGQVRWFLLNAEKCLVVNCCGLLRCKHLPIWFQNVAGCELAFIRAPCYLHLWPSLSVTVPSFQKISKWKEQQHISLAGNNQYLWRRL